jgi:hypothetical protein
MKNVIVTNGNEITLTVDKGVIGPQGPVGATGATGPQGPQGPTGTVTPSLQQLADEAEASALAASNSATSASSSASSATASAATATTQAVSATAQANTATTQAGIATAQAGIATTQAGIASAQASNAASSANTAANFSNTATTQAGIATTAATTATTAASTATTQATNASASATNAATSATNAATSATSASNSATSATTSASTATTQAGIATTQATNAATSATTATTQAGIATTQAGVATTQAGISTTQATSATSSATNAAASASSAATQASNAAGSATASANSATASANSATASAASATTAVNAPSTSGTSTTSITIPAVNNTITFTTQTAKAWVIGQFVTVSSIASPANFMYGYITAYNTGTGAMSVFVQTVGGSGTYASWSIGLSAPVSAFLVGQSDVGTNPNQIPLNQYLGDLAYMDVVNTISGNPYYDTAISDVQPTLNLDFVNAKTLDSRITFVRSTNATFYDAKSSAVAEQNLIKYSQEFDNAVWEKDLVTVAPNSTAAPDGNTTADLLAETIANNIHFCGGAAQAPIVSGQVYTFSVFLKKGTGATAPDIMQVSYGYVGFGSNVYANFNISTPAVTATGAGVSSSSIVSVGNGWYRCIFTATATATGNGALGIGFTNNNGSATRAPSYIGLTTSDAFVWGAQLEQRSAVTAYTPTTTTAIINFIPTLQTAAANVPRFDYDPITRVPNGLLIEESRANLFTYSEQFDNAIWQKVQTTISANSTTAPDGTLTADKVVSTATTNFFGVQTSNSIGSSWSYSVYAKAGGYDRLLMGTTNANFIGFNLTTGRVESTLPAGVTASILSVGNGWYRCSISSSSVVGGVTFYLLMFNAAFTAYNQSISFTADGFSGIFIWGAQLEAGAFPTSYIPTEAIAVTRAVDAASMTGTNFSSWYNQSQGVLYGSWTRVASNAVFAVLTGTSAPNSASSLYAAMNSNGNAQTSVYGGAYGSYSHVFSYTPTSWQIALSLGINTVSTTVNGVTLNTSTAAINPPASTQLILGGVFPLGANNGWIKKIQYYPVALSNAELQEMTA